jgi:hypothetical protein
MGIDRSLCVQVASAVFLAVSFIVLSLRCYVCVNIIRQFGWDDILIIVSVVS